MHRAIPALFIVAIAACAAALLPACGQDCTLVACMDKVALELPDPLPPGLWTIEIQSDGESWRCEGPVPAATREEIDCTGNDVWLDLRTDEAGAYHLEAVALHRAPRTLSYAVRHDGTEVANRADVQPRYRKLHPNGEECDGDYFCRTATVAIELEETP